MGFIFNSFCYKKVPFQYSRFKGAPGTARHVVRHQERKRLVGQIWRSSKSRQTCDNSDLVGFCVDNLKSNGNQGVMRAFSSSVVQAGCVSALSRLVPSGRDAVQDFNLPFANCEIKNTSTWRACWRSRVNISFRVFLRLIILKIHLPS